MKKRTKKHRKEESQLVQAIKRARKYGEKASVPWKQKINGKKFEYLFSDVISREKLKELVL